MNSHEDHLLGNEHNVSEVKRITWVSLAADLFLSALKFAAGILGNSQALVADAVHSLSDTITDVAVLVGVRFWTRPPDACHPHGHWRIEFLVAFFIGLLMAAAALGLAYNALISAPVRADPPRWIAFWAAVVSMVSKELLYRWAASVGRRINSAALIANAWHHRSDGISSIPAALAVIGAVLVPGMAWLDRAGAVVVSLIILHAAWKIIRPSIEQLIDRGAPEDVRMEITRLASSTQGVKEVHAIRSRHIGYGWQVDLHVLVDPDLTVMEGHRISEEVKQQLIGCISDVVDVVVHLEPYDGERR